MSAATRVAFLENDSLVKSIATALLEPEFVGSVRGRRQLQL